MTSGRGRRRGCAPCTARALPHPLVGTRLVELASAPLSGELPIVGRDDRGDEQKARRDEARARQRGARASVCDGLSPKHRR